nr:immunoglobulin heavy chain junction region [Macaca mulatta]MOX00091.1 immunoglobulin heavy chain junction region [Macaca mulatta]MOX01480.1 immunoglobulin heavy chain junction region [Macaca mulatta]MOX04547.1 immunoglobulin heavy chain junction region [Macaca mulatta]
CARQKGVIIKYFDYW